MLLLGSKEDRGGRLKASSSRRGEGGFGVGVGRKGRQEGRRQGEDVLACAEP